MRILMTGGAGYIGSALLHQMDSLGVEEVVVYDNLTHGRYGVFFGARQEQSLSRTKVTFIKGDLLDSRALKKCLSGIDIVIHLAAKVSTPFAHGDPHSFEQVNHWGTAELSYLLEDSSVRQLIYLSSAAVYGSSTKPLDEHASAQPRSWYGASKHRGEKMLMRLADHQQVHVLRCANVYGYAPSVRFDAVINRFLLQSHFEKRITIQGKGEQLRPFVHVDNVVSVLKGLIRSNIESGIYNLVQENRAIIDIAEALKTIYPELEMIFVEQDMERHSLIVSGSERLETFMNRQDFEQELRQFATHFGF